MKDAKEIEQVLLKRNPDTIQAAIILMKLNHISRSFIEASMKSGILKKYDTQKIVEILSDYETKLKSFNKLFFGDEIPKLQEENPSSDIFFSVFINFKIIKNHIKKLSKQNVLKNSTDKVISIALEISGLLEIMYKKNINILQENFLHVYNSKFMVEVYIIINDINKLIIE